MDHEPLTLYLGGTLPQPSSRRSAAATPSVTAFLVGDGVIHWVGTEAEAEVHRDAARQVVRLDGALLTTGFVDAHVHLSATGAALRGVDLTTARSLNEALARIETAARRTGGRPLLASNWDESAWPEGRPFSQSELDRATYGGVVYAPRVDGHSAVVSSALAAAARLRGIPGGAGLPGLLADGVVQTEAHHAAREAFARSVSPAQRRDDIRLALESAAAAGMVVVHENAGPVVSSADDLSDVQAVASSSGLPAATAYWAQLVSTADEARSVADAYGVRGLAGDLNVDGSIGSRTAALRDDYTDRPGQRGNAYLTTDEVRDHVSACTSAGLQAGFHVIGDAGVDTVIAGLLAAAAIVGEAAIRARRHRLEHLEMISAAGVAVLARLGVTASMQPAFDAAWGGDHRMYATRLGAERVHGMNPLRTMLDAGVALALGSDSPVTPFAPWDAIRACVHHHDPAQRLTADEAFHAHTTGGYQAAHLDPSAGVLRVGGPATFAVWDGWHDWADGTGRLLTAPIDAAAPVARLVLRDGAVLHGGPPS